MSQKPWRVWNLQRGSGRTTSMPLFRSSLFAGLLAFAATLGASNPPNPILYVTQVPMPDEINSRTVSQTSMSVASSFQNPLGDPVACGRGGALMFRRTNGTVRNLTLEAGFGVGTTAAGNVSGSQNTNGIAVQHPVVNWDASRALFSMVVGAPANAADSAVFFWQLYEITNLQAVIGGTAPVIAKVPNQPANYDNLHACYGTDGRIIFTSDRPIAGQAHLWPPLDEYLLRPMNSGLWSLDPATGDLKHLVSTPSGAFQPFVDSFGRLIFVQWDHLSRDPAAVTDKPPVPANGDTWTQTNNGMGNFASEAAGASFSVGTNDQYPEPRNFDKTSLVGTNFNGQAFNQFFPWQCFEDGSGHELQNHAGRHEFIRSITRSFTDDSKLVDFNASTVPRTYVDQVLSWSESASAAGVYFGVDGLDFGTHGAGNIFSVPLGPSVDPDNMVISYVTPRPSSLPSPPSAPLGTAVNLYRTPHQLSDGTLLASHTPATQTDHNTGTATAPQSVYTFRIKTLISNGTTMVPDITLTSGATATNVTYYAGGQQMTYNGPMWELDPVEVVARTKPTTLVNSVAAVEQTVFAEEGVDLPTFQKYLTANKLAAVISRNATRRDRADRQQPFNLKVAWSGTQTLAANYQANDKIYDVGWMQFVQGDFIRGLTKGGATPVAGRRVLPLPMHDTLTEMPSVAGAPLGSVKLGDDGSLAAIVPANRPVTWNLLNGSGNTSQVKERFWVNFAPGEVRTCAVCHGINTSDQANNLGAPQNKPQALRSLLQFWKANHPPGSLQAVNAAVSVQKNAGSITLTVSRTGGQTGPVSVSFTTVNGSAAAGTDFTATSGTLTWIDGDIAPKTITVPLLNNPAIGAAKTLTMQLSSPVNGSLGGVSAETVTLTEPPFQAWQYAQFGANANTAAIAGDSADPDGDGLPNLVEYLLGSPASNHQDVPPAVGTKVIGGTSYLTLTFTRDTTKTGIFYTAQTTGTLGGSWTDLSDILLGTNGSLETHEARIPLTTGAHFLRLKVTRP